MKNASKVHSRLEEEKKGFGEPRDIKRAFNTIEVLFEGYLLVLYFWNEV